MQQLNYRAQPAPDSLELALLGQPQVCLDGRAVTLPRLRTRALLFYLAAEPGAHPRWWLADLLWPGAPHRLRQLSEALTDLRNALGAHAVHSDLKQIAWAGAPADVTEFLIHLE